MTETKNKRGAKALAAAAPAGVTLDGELLDERSQALAAMNEHQQAVIEQFGDGLPWHLDHYETQIRSELRRGCEAFLRAGRYLVVARECAAHGEWSGMLDRLGMEPRQAHRMMETARRLANRSTSTDLLRSAQTSGKLIELLSLPEDQFAELAEEGETEGLTLEDVERMTVRELRAAVREARADIQAKDDRAAKRERDLEALQKELRAARHVREQASPDEAAAELRTRANLAAMQVRADLAAQGDEVDSLLARFAELREHAIEAGGPDALGDEHDTFMAGLLGELFSELRRVRDHFGLPIVNDHGAPDWQQQGG